MVKAIVGANWGDEGKGKITDICAAESDIVVRFQGGSNAGHTIINDYGKFALHLLPSGVFYDNITNVLANGVALNIEYLLNEIKYVEDRGVHFNLKVSDRAQILMPHHVLFDKLEEERLGDKAFGSTKSGIAPFYSDKYAKVGIQVNELFYESHLKERIQQIAEKVNMTLKSLYNHDPIDVDSLYETLRKQGSQIERFVDDTALYLQNAIKENKTILLEGQLGTLKDTDHGIYPMVTSSSTLAGFAGVGAGIPPYEIKNILAVTKAYSSAVGGGAFVSEMFGDDAEELRKRGGDAGEYGATTGRPRRVGYFDMVATKYGCRMQGATEVALTNLDVLGYMENIKICTGYEVDGKVINAFPVTPVLEKCKPVFETLEGWKSDISGIKKFADLPKQAQQYVEFIEKGLETPITVLSNGPKRSEMIER